MTDGEFPYVRMEPKERWRVWIVKESDHDGRCETCKRWQASRRMKHWGYCGKVKDYDTCAIVRENAARLETRRDFGCVQWEAKDEL